MAIFNSYLPFLFAWTLISFGTGLESLGNGGKRREELGKPRNRQRGRSWGKAITRSATEVGAGWPAGCNLNCNRITRRLQQQDLGPQSAQTNVIIIYIYIYSIYIYIHMCSYCFQMFPALSLISIATLRVNGSQIGRRATLSTPP